MNKNTVKLFKYFQQADQCLSRKKAQKILKKAEKVQRKLESLDK